MKKNHVVRTRIAPSPTGSPHVGTAYIALFNLAFAESQGGTFILRIEDTDQERSRPEFEKGILDALRWLGIQWKEGPDIGGKHGPYRQSERTDIYRKYCNALIESGKAYRCFCTPERLAEMRARQRETKSRFGYDGFCRNLPEDTIRQNLDKGMPFVIRQKTPETGECTFADRFRGTITYNYNSIDDQILMKSDGFPTYHLANVVDDHLMGITHVIRGEEWVPSTPKHILLYQAFNWTPPEFIHVPLLLNPDGSKLSKRKNPTSILFYREAGILPETLLNYLGLMSYSRPNQEEKFSLEAFISDFDIDRMRLGGSIFDLRKLTWLNGRYIRENFTPEELLDRIRNWKFNDAFMTGILTMMQKRMETLGDFVSKCAFFFQSQVDFPVELLVPKNREISEVAELLQTVLWTLEALPEWSFSEIETGIKSVAEFWDWKIRDVTSVLFTAITGSRVGPPLFNAMELLGIDICRHRLMHALETAGGLGKKKLKKLEKKWRNH